MEWKYLSSFRLKKNKVLSHQTTPKDEKTSPKFLKSMIKKKNGELTPVEVLSRPIFPAKKYNVFLVVAQGISNRRGLRKKWKEYEKIPQTARMYPYWCVYYHREHLQFVNDRICEISGSSKEELDGMRIWKLIPKKKNDTIQEVLQNQRIGEALPPSFETQIVTKHGEIKTLELAVIPITYNEKKVFLGTVRVFSRLMLLLEDEAPLP